MTRRVVAVGVPLALIGVIGAGCGSSDNKATTATKPAAPAKTTAAAPSASGGAASKVPLSADPSGALKFVPAKLTAKSGNVTLVMANPSSLQHAVAIEGNGVDKDGQPVTQGGTSTVTANLKPGKYTFYCPVDSHRQQGMQGTLTVT